jgi:hypothetical protein
MSKAGEGNIPEINQFNETFEHIVSFIENFKKIREFVEGELVVILETIADTEYKAAGSALQNVKLAKHPKNQVLLAVGHLQSAHIASREMYAPKGWKDNFTLAVRMSAVQKDLFTLGLLAICYPTSRGAGVSSVVIPVRSRAILFSVIARVVN